MTDIKISKEINGCRCFKINLTYLNTRAFIAGISTRVSFFPSKIVSYLFIRKDLFRNLEKILYRIAFITCKFEVFIAFI